MSLVIASASHKTDDKFLHNCNAVITPNKNSPKIIWYLVHIQVFQIVSKMPICNYCSLLEECLQNSFGSKLHNDGTSHICFLDGL